ncbi:MAG: thiamine pyrophosphate-dependent enzyme, partial [Leeuwenhoekiella sp.]
KELQPDLLLTFGGMIISKKIKAFLRKYQPKQHWHIDPKKAYDTFFSLNRHFSVSVNHFFAQFTPHIIPVKTEYKNTWLALRSRRDILHKEYLKNMDWCDFKAFEHILSSIPKESMLQLGNSSTVRYVQLFDIDKSLEVFCNRGTSGIDGCVSTAVGAAVGSKLPAVLILGDLSFFYDSNGLWNNYLPDNFKIILINNRGGGIFRILPGDKNSEEFDTYFETVHNLSAEHLCKMYNIKFLSASSEAEVENKKEELFKSNDGPALLEINTPRKLNDQILLGYFDFIK